jgi:parallel beta-helix repeat protein/uncharacterized repeat protein (TIGR03803 family)
MRNENARKALCAFVAILMVGTSFAVCISMNAEALDFIDTTTIDTPWTSSFTPLDSAWDANGTQCVVVGNDTSGTQSSAWTYNEPSNKWYPILEGSDAAVKPVHLVRDEGTGITYATIQQAINAASSGATLRVWAGTYCENVVVNKTLTLVGNGSANTIIDGENSGTAVLITSDGVRLNGFTATGGSDHTGILLYEVDNCRIENNTVEGNGDGICVSGSSNNIIKNNDVQNNAGVGVRTKSSPATKDIVGTTESGGVRDNGAMFKMNLAGDNYSIINDFIPGYTDGANPSNGFKFIADIYDTNILYGVTRNGGSYDCGVLFRINRNGSNHIILHHFLGGTADGERPDGSLHQTGTNDIRLTKYPGLIGFASIKR